jgi:hypothetical protein
MHPAPLIHEGNTLIPDTVLGDLGPMGFGVEPPTLETRPPRTRRYPKSPNLHPTALLFEVVRVELPVPTPVATAPIAPARPMRLLAAAGALLGVGGLTGAASATLGIVGGALIALWIAQPVTTAPTAPAAVASRVMVMAPAEAAPTAVLLPASTPDAPLANALPEPEAPAPSQPVPRRLAPAAAPPASLASADAPAPRAEPATAPAAPPRVSFTPAATDPLDDALALAEPARRRGARMSGKRRDFPTD